MDGLNHLVEWTWGYWTCSREESDGGVLGESVEKLAFLVQSMPSLTGSMPLAGRVSPTPPEGVASAVCAALPSTQLTSDELPLEEFLKLGHADRSAFLANPMKAARLKAAIVRADQSKIVNEKAGRTLFLELCASPERDVRKLALLSFRKGAKLEATSKDGKTALHYAILQNDVPLTELLLEEYRASGHSLANAKTLSGDPLWMSVILAMGRDDLLPVDTLRLLLAEQPNLSLRMKGKTIFEQLQDEDAFPLLDRLVMESVLLGLPLDFWDLSLRSAVESSVMGLLSGPFKEDHEHRVCQALLTTGWASLTISSILDQPTRSLVGAMMQHPNVDEETLKICQQIGPPDVIEALDKLAMLEERFRTAQFSIFARVQIAHDMEKAFETLLSHEFPHTDRLYLELAPPFLFATRSIMDKLANFVQRAEKEPALLANAVASLGEDHRYLEGYLVLQEKADLYIELCRQGKMVDKNLFHMLLDKMVWEAANPYQGYTASASAALLADNLERAVEASWGPWDQELKDLKGALAETTLPLLKQYALFAYGSNMVGKSTHFSQTLFAKVSAIRVGDKLLVPTGCARHATALLVERTSEDSARLISYNTGYGLQPDQRLPGTSKYQTMRIINEVPFINLLNSNLWYRLSELRQTADTMEPTDRLIELEMGKGGVLLSPSPHPEDYESKQHEGTCSFQSLMAFLRQQVMSEVRGTKRGQLAAYKMVKSQVLLPYAKENKRHASAAIQEALATPMRKLKAEMSLADLAHQPDRYDASAKELGAFLQSIGEDLLALAPGGAESGLARYAFLRRASGIQSDYWMTHMIQPSGTKQSEALTRARTTHHQAIMYRYMGPIVEDRDGLMTKTWIADRIVKMLTEGPLLPMSLAIVVSQLPLRSPREEQVLRKVIEGLKPLAPELILKLAATYREAKLEQAAKFVEGL